MTFEQFILKHKITSSSVRVDKNPNMKNGSMDHWKTTLKMNGRRFTTIFSQGYGFKGMEPTVEDVLDSVQMEVSSIQDGYDWFLSTYGYEDNCESKRIFKAGEKLEVKLKKFFGAEYAAFTEVEN